MGRFLRAVVMALGGSTNAVLHLLAIAREAEVDLSLDDFNRVGAKVPHLGDLKPFGRYVMTDVDKIGGIPVVMKALLDAGLMHGDTLTVTGKTMRENLEALNPKGLDGDVLRELDKPIHATGGLTILKGSLAPEGAVVKSAGFDDTTFTGTARVFDGERAALDALAAGQIKHKDVVVIRYEGPKGGPGMREMLAITGAIDHRRAILGWNHGSLRRTHRARSSGRRADRLRPRRRPDHPRCRQPDVGGGDARSGTAQGGLGTEPSEVHPRRARQVRQDGSVRGPWGDLRLRLARTFRHESVRNLVDPPQL